MPYVSQYIQKYAEQVMQLPQQDGYIVAYKVVNHQSTTLVECFAQAEPCCNLP